MLGKWVAQLYLICIHCEVWLNGGCLFSKNLFVYIKRESTIIQKERGDNGLFIKIGNDNFIFVDLSTLETFIEC